MVGIWLPGTESHPPSFLILSARAQRLRHPADASETPARRLLCSRFCSAFRTCKDRLQSDHEQESRTDRFGLSLDRRRPEPKPKRYSGSIMPGAILESSGCHPRDRFIGRGLNPKISAAPRVSKVSENHPAERPVAHAVTKKSPRAPFPPADSSSPGKGGPVPVHPTSSSGPFHPPGVP